MNEHLEKALEFSNYQQTLSVQRKALKERTDGRLTYATNGGVFKIDSNLICFVRFLIDEGKIVNVPLLDANNNPILIVDMTKFKEEILSRYYSATLEYYHDYEKIKKSRSVEKLVNL